MRLCKWCCLATPPAPDGDRTCGGTFTCTHRQAYDEGHEQGRADERAAIVAWLMMLPFYPMLTVEDVIDSIGRGDHEKKP